MGTKWRSRMAFLGLVLLFTCGVSALLGFFQYGNHYLKKDYFHTSQFEGQYMEFISGLSRYELNDQTAEESKGKITITPEEVNEYRNRNGSLSEQVAAIKEEYRSKIQEAHLAENIEVAEAYQKERDQKLKEVTNSFKSDDYVRKKIREEKEKAIDQQYADKEQEREQFNAYKDVFKYYLKNTSTGKEYTNVNLSSSSLNEVFDDKNMLHIRKYNASNGLQIDAGGNYSADTPGYAEAYYEDIDPADYETYEGRIAVVKHAPASNPIMRDYVKYKNAQRGFFIFIISGLIAFAVSVWILRKKAVIPAVVGEKWKTIYNKIPADLAAVAFLVTSLVTMLFMSSMNSIFLSGYSDYYLNFTWSSDEELIVMFVALTAAAAIALLQGKLLWMRIQEGPGLKAEGRSTLVYRLIVLLGDTRFTSLQLLIFITIFFFTGFGVPIVAWAWGEGLPDLLFLYLLLFVCIPLPAFILLLKKAAYLKAIIRHTARMAAGYSEENLPVKGNSLLAKLAQDLNQLKQGVRASQKEQAKSERLKTELITNVSHDLRTPLTSIITYTELLKTPGLDEEERAAYTEIIDRKSQRLKVLIDDLFEASKMASGNAELHKENADLVQLLQQALAEYSEAIEESSLQFRVTIPDEPVHACVDGQKIWRVFDNLIGNILKYSLEQTRVYISMKTTDSQAVITFKNVTKYELGDNLDELFERFKRGDRSRHTEGSGLGLAIAKSIIDLHDGQMDIEVDGDLFKVTVLLDTLY
ncbi:sensor histidine kinase [Bacillus xiapuensis]|uniref:sensor histidine kinase n=1 Tax=Bacillus xiapuensis TaxID=2014075 RepID=UPI000C24B944|nr:HAMP domain-containing sensor histidine kinase [Bacillus xiapuensis]